MITASLAFNMKKKMLLCQDTLFPHNKKKKKKNQKTLQLYNFSAGVTLHFVCVDWCVWYALYLFKDKGSQFPSLEQKYR